MSTRKKGIDKMNKDMQKKRKADYDFRQAFKKKKFEDMTPAEQKRERSKSKRGKRTKSHNTIPANLARKLGSRTGSTGNVKLKG